MVLSVIETWIEETVGVGGEFVGGLSDTVTSVTSAIGDIPTEAARFVDDPGGYVVEQLASAARDYAQDLVDGASLGLSDLAVDALGEIGLRPLLDGVAAVAAEIDKAIDKALLVALCAKYAQSPPFWTLVGAFVGARASGLISTRDDCEPLLQAGALAELVQNVPWVDMLDCARNVAFEMPVPPRRAVQRGPTVPASAPLAPCALVSLNRHAVGRRPPQMAFLAWKEADAVAEIRRLWGDGWRIRTLDTCTAGGEVLWDVVLVQNHVDQVWMDHHKPSDETEAWLAPWLSGGWGVMTLSTCVLGRTPLSTAVVTRRKAGTAVQQPVFAQTLQWWRMGKADVAGELDDPLGQRQYDRVRLVDSYMLDGVPHANVVLGEPTSPNEDRRLGWALPFSQFASQHDALVQQGFALEFMAAHTEQGRLRISAAWNKRRVTLARRAEQRSLLGWRFDDAHSAIGRLQTLDFQVTHLTSYVA